jgi:hypothetical protein
MTGGGRAPSSGYGVLNIKATTPTWSRWLGHSVLLTFGGGNVPREDSDGGAVRPGFDDGNSGSWWRSGYKKQSCGFLVTSSSSLTGLQEAILWLPRDLLQFFDNLNHFWCWRIKLTRWLSLCARVWCCGQNFVVLGTLYIGVLVPMRRGFGILTNLSPTQFQITADKEKSRRE